MRYAAKRDTTEPAIVDALQRFGCTVVRLSQAGVPDLLVRTPDGCAHLVECKAPHGTRTPAQSEVPADLGAGAAHPVLGGGGQVADRLVSPNGRTVLNVQDDGNVVVYYDTRPIWATNSAQPTPPTPPPSPVTDTWPRKGLSYYTSLTDPRVAPRDFFDRLRDAGADYTRVWLFDAWAIPGGTGCYDGWLPWERTSDGRYDLWTASRPYHDRLRAYVEAAADRGVLVQLDGLELYTWSDRKQGMLWVPDAERWAFRRNIQGAALRRRLGVRADRAAHGRGRLPVEVLRRHRADAAGAAVHGRSWRTRCPRSRCTNACGRRGGTPATGARWRSTGRRTRRGSTRT